MHDIVASVPLFTIRTFSIDGTQRQISSAISTSSGFTHSINHNGGRMPKNGWPPGADVIDIFPAVDVPDVGALRALDKKWLTTQTAESTDGRVDTAGNQALRPIEE